jgi:predicted nuclease of predicted toxin-antitoxin system
VKWLVDNALSPAVATGLQAAGHDAVHLRDRGLSSASDAEIFETAIRENRVILPADTDFGTLLALRSVSEPSVVLFRGATPRRPAAQIAIVLANFPVMEHALNAGAIIIIEPARPRIRPLPIVPQP